MEEQERQREALEHLKDKLNNTMADPDRGKPWKNLPDRAELGQALDGIRLLKNLVVKHQDYESGARLRDVEKTLLEQLDELDNRKQQDPLEDQEFYELMQAYRHTPSTQQERLTQAFEAVKDYVRENKEDIA